jgi:ABC-type multidrug transport system permease subunit
MVFFRIVRKNLLLLARSKSTSFIIIAGPILVILLSGLFFGQKSAYELSIGYYSPSNESLSGSFVAALKDSDFVVLEFLSEELCAQAIRDSKIHTCIVFPAGFEVRNARSAEVRFIVDYSRVNLVYKVIDSVSGILEEESKGVGRSLASALTVEINQTINSLKGQEGQGRLAASKMQSLGQESIQSAMLLSRFNFAFAPQSLDKTVFNLNKANESLGLARAKSMELQSYAEGLVVELSDFVDENRTLGLYERLGGFSESLDSLGNETDKRLGLVYSSIESLAEDFKDVEEQSLKNTATKKGLEENFAKSQASLGALSEEVNDFLASSISMRRSLESIAVTRPETIVSPVNSRIEPLVVEESNFKSTIPFLIILVLMFSSIIISSTLAVFESSSKAVFRNSMAPVQQKVFVLATFATAVLVAFAQAILILGISKAFIGEIPISRVPAILLIALIAVVFFSSIGLLLGHLFSSQEGASLASLLAGASFMFLSNLVVPLESVTPGLLAVIRHNPFVVLSELLRKALLFGASAESLMMPIAVLLWLSASIYLLISVRKGWLGGSKRLKV